MDSTFMCVQLYCLLYCVPHIVETSLIHGLSPTSQCVLYGEIPYYKDHYPIAMRLTSYGNGNHLCGTTLSSLHVVLNGEVPL